MFQSLIFAWSDVNKDSHLECDGDQSLQLLLRVSSFSSPRFKRGCRKYRTCCRVDLEHGGFILQKGF